MQVLECMDAIDEQQPDWGITFFEYDWFSATRRAVAREFRYDTFITVYMSDCDYYPRVSDFDKGLRSMQGQLHHRVHAASALADADSALSSPVMLLPAQ